MADKTFALIEEGSPRAVLFKSDGSRSFRTLAGVWTPRLSLEDTIMPDEFKDFRAASNNELSALVQDAQVED